MRQKQRLLIYKDRQIIIKLIFGLLEDRLEHDRQVWQTGLDLVLVKYQRQRRDIGLFSKILALVLKGVVAYDVLFLVASLHSYYLSKYKFNINYGPRKPRL